MNNQQELYKDHLKNSQSRYRELNIDNNEGLVRQFHIVSAGLMNYLPDLPYEKHEEIFKNILLHQQLSILEQAAACLLNNIEIKHFDGDTIQSLKRKPAIICTFHLGSYRLINLLLAKQGIPFSLVVTQKLLEEQGSSFKKLFNRNVNTENSVSFNLINGESSGSAMSMFRELKKGKNLVVYIDGNTGAGRVTNQNENSCLISFLNQQLITRKGVGFLSHAAAVPILPVICYREPLEKITLQFFDFIFPDKKEGRNLYAQRTTQNIYDLAAPFISRYPEQWEAWLYLHKVAHIVKPSAQYTHLPKAPAGAKLKFNSVRYGLFTVSEKRYIFNKSNYIAYPLSDYFYQLLKEASEQPIDNRRFDVNLFHELYNKRVLINKNENEYPDLKKKENQNNSIAHCDMDSV